MLPILASIQLFIFFQSIDHQAAYYAISIWLQVSELRDVPDPKEADLSLNINVIAFIDFNFYYLVLCLSKPHMYVVLKIQCCYKITLRKNSAPLPFTSSHLPKAITCQFIHSFFHFAISLPVV